MRNSAFVLSIMTAFLVLITTIQCSRQSGDQEFEAELKERGAYIVDTTFKVLSSHLKTAVQDSGVVYAIQFCNLNAMPLVDTLSSTYGVQISRRTKKSRNINNQADAQDKIYLRSYKIRLERGEELLPLLVEQGNRISYYKPILIQPMCQVCHGSPEMIGPAYETISDLYPSDKAIDYNVGDLRGVWRVDFNRELIR